jgi:hypothetical protein
LQAVQDYPVASRYLLYRSEAGSAWQVLEAEYARQTGGDPVLSYRSAEGTGEARWSNGHYVLRGPEDRFIQEFNISEAGSYYLYLAYLCQGLPREGLSVETIRVSTPPVIDGELDEWSSARLVFATTTNNILRGAGGWGGPEKDALSAI